MKAGGVEGGLEEFLKILLWIFLGLTGLWLIGTILEVIAVNAASAALSTFAGAITSPFKTAANWLSDTLSGVFSSSGGGTDLPNPSQAQTAIDTGQPVQGVAAQQQAPTLPAWASGNGDSDAQSIGLGDTLPDTSGEDSGEPDLPDLPDDGD